MMTEAAVKAIAKAAYDVETIRRDLMDAGLETLARKVDALRAALFVDYNKAVRQFNQEQKIPKEPPPYECVCSYPYGPHLIHCENYNARKAEKQASG